MDGDDLDPPDPLGPTGMMTPTPIPASPDGLAPGVRLGRYRLVGKIGGGAMGVVWRARDPKLDRDIAIKVVHPSLARLPDAAARLLREARALAKVSHSAVVAVHDAGQEDDRLFVAMELIEGTTLGHMIRARAPVDLRDWRRSLALMVEAGVGLAAAHAAGVLHRDFKPDNVLVSDAGRVCVADFGLAEIALGLQSTPRRPSSVDLGDSWRADDSLTLTGAVVGTPAYMSPEQLTSGVVDGRSDQFAFCVAAYEVLYGHRPFACKPAPDQPPAAALLEEIRAGRILPAPRDSKIPRWLREVVIRGLAAAPEDRWPDMTALLAAARPPARRGVWVAGAVAALVAAIAIGWAVTRTGPQPTDTRLFPMPMWSGVVSSPDGQRIAYIDDARIYVRAVAAHGPAPMDLATGGLPGRVEFETPDRVVFSLLLADQRMVLRGWNLSTGVVDDVVALAGWAEWYGRTPRGHIVSRPRDGGGEELAVVAGDSVDVFGDVRTRVIISALAPGHTRFAYADDAGAGFAGRIVIYDAGDDRAVASARIPELTGITWIDDGHLAYSTGTSERPTLWTAAVAATGELGAPARLWRTELGWFGDLSVAPGRLRFVDTQTTFVARWIDRDSPGASHELDPASVTAGLGWGDDGRPLGWQRTSGRVVRFTVLADHVDVATSTAALDTDVGNATRAGDILIVSLRRTGGREVVAVSLADGHRMWSRPVGGALLVRCAGDRHAPCFEVRQPAAGTVEIHAVDPGTGVIGAVIPAPATVGDISVSDDGAELIISDGLNKLYRVELGDPAPALEPGTTISLPSVRGVAHDPRGGLLIAGTRNNKLYQVLRVVPDHPDEILMQSSNDLMSVPRPSPDGSHVLVLTRRYMPVLHELLGVL